MFIKRDLPIVANLCYGAFQNGVVKHFKQAFNSSAANHDEVLQHYTTVKCKNTCLHVVPFSLYLI